MGAINPSKMPKAKTIIRKDDPNKVKMYDEGGEVSEESVPLKRSNNSGNPRWSNTLEEDYLKRLSVSGGGSSSDGVTQFGGRVGYTHPLDEKTKLSGGISGHYAKGKNFKDAGVDRGDIGIEHQLDRNSSIKAMLGTGRRGVDEGRVTYNKRFADGGEVWNQPRPKGLGKPKQLTPAKKSAAKKAAKAAGRPYPNLVDNMRMARKK